MASLSSFEMLGFRGFAFYSTNISFHICLSARALGILKATSSIAAIKSN